MTTFARPHPGCQERETTLSSLRPELAREVAVVHRCALPAAWSSRLGERYCTRWYERYARAGEAIAFCAHGGGRVLGFVIGCPPEVEVQIRRAMLGEALSAVVRDPAADIERGTIRRMLRYAMDFFHFPSRGKRASPRETRVVKLVNLGVLPEANGQGLGTRLVDAFCEAARARGFERVTLEVAAQNVVAMRLYERRGFRREPASDSSGGVQYVRELCDSPELCDAPDGGPSRSVATGTAPHRSGQ